MLRFPSTRIDLTSMDIREFTKRMLSRRFPDVSRPQVRLSPGPRHWAGTGFVSAEFNIGRARAASSASEATICNSDGEALTHVQSASPLSSTQLQPQTSPRKAVGSSSDNATPKYDFSPSRPTQFNRNNGQSSPLAQLREPLNNSSGPPNLDGALEQTHSGQTSFQSTPPPFSSARARRRNVRSQEVPLYHDPDPLQQYIEARHVERLRPTHLQLVMGMSPVIPELMVPGHSEISRLPPNPSLDPGAAVFVPRTRFGSANASSLAAEDYQIHGLRPQWSSMDSTHSSSNLRIRTRSEQNTEMSNQPRPEPVNLQNDRLHPRQRVISRTSDQNVNFSLPAPNIGRYPELRPPVRTTSHRRGSGTYQRPVAVSGRWVSRVQSQTQLSLTFAETRSQGSVRPISSNRDEIHSRSTVRAVSSTASLASNTSSNIFGPPQPRYADGGRRDSAVAMPARAPNIRRTSHTSDGEAVSIRQTSGNTSRLIHLRNSPLDDLAERLGQLSAGRPRSVGHSFERGAPVRPRDSLLSGDIFQREPSPTRSITPDCANSDDRSAMDNDDVIVSDPATVDLDGIPFPAHPVITQVSPGIPSSSSAYPSTPPIHSDAVQSHRSPLAHLSPTRPPFTPSRTVPSPVMMATPRVRIYHDHEPAATQPQTPADIYPASSRRRLRGISDADQDMQPEPPSSPPIIPVLTAPTRSPPAIPVRHRHRYTYPTTTPAQPDEPAATRTNPAPIPPSPTQHPPAVPPSRYRRRRLAQQNGSHTSNGRGVSEENEVEPHLEGLEADRQIWHARRDERGSLDVTPPGEGRWERYLS